MFLLIRLNGTVYTSVILGWCKIFDIGKVEYIDEI